MENELVTCQVSGKTETVPFYIACKDCNGDETRCKIGCLHCLKPLCKNIAQFCDVCGCSHCPEEECYTCNYIETCDNCQREVYMRDLKACPGPMCDELFVGKLLCQMCVICVPALLAPEGVVYMCSECAKEVGH